MSDEAPLTQHIDTVYTLACALVGSDQALSLTRRVFEKATDVPPRDRPPSRALWLMECTLNTYREGTAGEASPNALRAKAAKALIHQVLPAAWAACSAHDRTLLTARLGLDLSPAAVATLVDLAPDEVDDAVRSARSSLRATLRDMLVGPQRMLIDTAFPDEKLNASIRTFLLESYGSPPPKLRKQVAQMLRAERTPSARTRAERDSRRRAQWLKTGGVIAALLVLIMLGWGIRALWTVPSESDGPANLIEFSVQHADVLRPLFETEEPDSLRAFWTAETNGTLQVPNIARTRLVGLSILPLEPDPVPVLQYYDTDAQASLRVFAYSYAQLDQLDAQAALPRSIRQTLDSEDTFVEQSVHGRPILAWRVRDRIYIAVFASAARDARPQRVDPSPQ